MRRIRYALTFNRDLRELLAYGALRFGKAVADSKSDDLFATIVNVLIPRPTRGKRVRKLKVFKCEIRSAPLVILYDFDDDEIRFHTVVHARSDIPNTDLSEIAW